MASDFRLLLDTSVVLWAASVPERLSEAARNALLSDGAQLFVSHASVWEVQIKHAAGKLPLPDRADIVVSRIVTHLGADFLPIRLDHIRGLYELAPHHRDPFDRLLVAQARAEDLAFVTPDASIARYDVRAIW